MSSLRSEEKPTLMFEQTTTTTTTTTIQTLKNRES